MFFAGTGLARSEVRGFMLIRKVSKRIKNLINFLVYPPSFLATGKSHAPDGGGCAKRKTARLLPR